MRVIIWLLTTEYRTSVSFLNYGISSHINIIIICVWEGVGDLWPSPSSSRGFTATLVVDDSSTTNEVAPAMTSLRRRRSQ